MTKPVRGFLFVNGPGGELNKYPVACTIVFETLGCLGKLIQINLSETLIQRNQWLCVHLSVKELLLNAQRYQTLWISDIDLQCVCPALPDIMDYRISTCCVFAQRYLTFWISDLDLMCVCRALPDILDFRS